jgi:hypothetical protein
MKLQFGVYRSGKLVIPLGLPVVCTHKRAALIISILDLTKSSLIPGDYYACDYTN